MVQIVKKYIMQSYTFLYNNNKLNLSDFDPENVVPRYLTQTTKSRLFYFEKIICFEL